MRFFLTHVTTLKANILKIEKLEKFIDAISFVDGVDYKVVITFNGIERCPEVSVQVTWSLL